VGLLRGPIPGPCVAEIHTGDSCVYILGTYRALPTTYTISPSADSSHYGAGSGNLRSTLVLGPHSLLLPNPTQKWLKRKLRAPRQFDQKKREPTGSLYYSRDSYNLELRSGERPSAPVTNPTPQLGSASAGTETNAFPHDTYGEMQRAKRLISKEERSSRPHTRFRPDLMC